MARASSPPKAGDTAPCSLVSCSTNALASLFPGEHSTPHPFNSQDTVHVREARRQLGGRHPTRVSSKVRDLLLNKKPKSHTQIPKDSRTPRPEAVSTHTPRCLLGNLPPPAPTAGPGKNPKPSLLTEPLSPATCPAPSICSGRHRSGQMARDRQEHIPCLGCRQGPCGVPGASTDPLAKHHVF